MKPYLSKIDTNTSGNRNDVTPLFADAQALSRLADDLARPFRTDTIDCVAAIDALGFILGTAVALSLGVGLVPVRKGGKLPVEADRVAFVDYSGLPKALELRIDALTAGMNVLLVDEWIETGAQMAAAVALVEKQGARVAGIASICVDDNEATAKLRSTYKVHAVWEDGP